MRVKFSWISQNLNTILLRNCMKENTCIYGITCSLARKHFIYVCYKQSMHQIWLAKREKKIKNLSLVWSSFPYYMYSNYKILLDYFRLFICISHRFKLTWILPKACLNFIKKWNRLMLCWDGEILLYSVLLLMRAFVWFSALHSPYQSMQLH